MDPKSASVVLRNFPGGGGVGGCFFNTFMLTNSFIGEPIKNIDAPELREARDVCSGSSLPHGLCHPSHFLLIMLVK